MSSLPSTHRRSQGFTLIELLVVISIIAILAGMLLPVIGVVREMARSAQCGKNQSQIIGAMVAYGTTEEVAWPDPRGGTKWVAATLITSGLNAAEYTATCFELVAVAQSLPPGLFKCPSAAGGGPDKALKPSTLRAFNTGPTWGWTGLNKVSYGFDFSSPADPGSARVILADRDIKNHKDKVQAVFGDAHTKPLKEDRTSSITNDTMGVLGVPLYAVYNPDAKGAYNQPDETAAASLTKDNIFDTVGDAAAPTETLVPGGGHATRACIR
jgi:prepilin-type N-terminal cleavage/methylation domain-containing protein